MHKNKKLVLHRESIHALSRPELRGPAGGTDTGITLCDLLSCIPTTKRTTWIDA